MWNECKDTCERSEDGEKYRLFLENLFKFLKRGCSVGVER